MKMVLKNITETRALSGSFFYLQKLSPTVYLPSISNLSLFFALLHGLEVA